MRRPLEEAALIALLALLCSASGAAGAAAVQDPATGWIDPPQGAPDFDPSAWNQAYKVTLRGVPCASCAAGATVPNGTRSTACNRLASSRWVANRMNSAPFGVPQNCSTQGFDTVAAASVPLGACFVQGGTAAGTFDLWIKVAGLARRDGNCYCYALDLFRGDYCRPSNDSVITCPALSASLKCDGAQPVSKQEAMGGQPQQGHYVALLAKPAGCSRYSSADFHFLRRDAGTAPSWSWKLPSRPPSNRDVFGSVIADPEAQPVPGYYTVCGYFRLEPAKMFVKDADKSPGPIENLQILKAMAEEAGPGASLDISPLPYNEATDAEVPEREVQLDEGDRKFHAARGSKEYSDWVRTQRVRLELEASADPKDKDPCSARN